VRTADTITASGTGASSRALLGARSGA